MRATMIEIDLINQKILRLLTKEGRISNADLAERVGLSASACLRRVQSLEKSGVISGYRAQINQAKLGNLVTIFVMVGLNEHRSKDAKAFEDAIIKAEEVRECHNVSGAVEYLLRIEVSDLVAYKKFHSEILGEISQVASITSYICLGSPKDDRV